MSVRLSVSRSVCFDCLCSCVSVFLSICLSVCLFVSVGLCRSVCILLFHVFTDIYLYVCIWLYVSLYLSICPFTCLFESCYLASFMPLPSSRCATPSVPTYLFKAMCTSVWVIILFLWLYAALSMTLCLFVSLLFWLSDYGPVCFCRIESRREGLEVKWPRRLFGLEQER